MVKETVVLVGATVAVSTAMDIGVVVNVAGGSVGVVEGIGADAIGGVSVGRGTAVAGGSGVGAVGNNVEEEHDTTSKARIKTIRSIFLISFSSW